MQCSLFCSGDGKSVTQLQPAGSHHLSLVSLYSGTTGLLSGNGEQLVECQTNCCLQPIIELFDPRAIIC